MAKPPSGDAKQIQNKSHSRDNPAQSERFIEIARELGADESIDAMDRAFKKVISNPPRRKVPDQNGNR
jgi:hypothetical protein